MWAVCGEQWVPSMSTPPVSPALCHQLAQELEPCAGLESRLSFRNMQLGLGVYNFSVQNLQLFLTTRGFLQSCFSRASPDSFRIGSMQLFHASAFQFHTKGTWKGCRNFPLLESTAGQQTLFFLFLQYIIGRVLSKF